MKVRRLNPYELHQLQEKIKAPADTEDEHTMTPIGPTPRTDAIAKVVYKTQFEYSAAMTRHARDLERELAASIVAAGELAIKFTPQPVAAPKEIIKVEKVVEIRYEQPTQKVSKPKTPMPWQRYEKMSNDEVLSALRNHRCIGAKQREAEKNGTE